MNSEDRQAVPYIRDVEYIDNYYPHQAPALMAYIAALNGYAAPRLDREFTYCELGCGRGLTSIALAALHPKGKFHACDFNEAHVQGANALLAAGKVGNLKVLNRSFGAMLKERLPRFDFITLHGVWSWVPDTVRAEILAFLKARLKPGGLAMVSYNALPGWAHLQPIRHMMQTYAASLPGDSIERARQALSYVRHLAENQAAFFTMNPAAAEHLASIGKADIRYVAHEYMTPHGDPFYFPQVCTAMGGAGLSFAGNMGPEENYAELAVRPALLPLINTAPSRVVLETHRDFIANTRFRRDLYAAAPEMARAPTLTLAALEGLAFSLANLPEHLPLKGSAGAIQYDLTPTAAAVRTVHELLEKGPATAAEIHAALAPRPEGETVPFLQRLVLVRHLQPCAPPGPAGWSPLSSALLEAAIREKKHQVSLPGSRSGTLHAFEMPFALVLEASRRLEAPGAAAREAQRRLKDAGYQVNIRSAAGEVSAGSDEKVLEDLLRVESLLRDPASAEARFARLHGVR
jgi:SAM-dependent methyltransferase